MATKVVVMGAGPGGYVAAVRAAQLGAEVTVIEPDHVGGTCLNWGCIPSKVLITTAELFEKLRRGAEFGIVAEGALRIDMQRLMARKQTVIDNQRKGILGLFQHHKIHFVKGQGTITRRGGIAVRAAGADPREIEWDKLIIATGTRPLEMPGLPFDGRRVLSSNDALGLAAVPRSVLIVGGGVIGCEFACLLSALGARVTIVEALSRLLPLPAVDEDCAKVLQRELKKRKVGFLVDRVVEGFERREENLVARIGPSPLAQGLSAEDRATLDLEVEKILVCVGRHPNSRAIGLEHIGVRIDERGWIPADERMRTAAADVYAIGDVLGPAKIMLAHVASMEGMVAAENAMGGSRRMSYEAVPGAIFTSPEVATVGLSESQARSRGLEVRTDRVLFRNLGKAQVLGDIAGEAKMISLKTDGRILGVHLIGPHVTDLIGEAALAVRMGARVADLAETIHAHPTLTEIMLEAALKATDRALHG